MAEMATVICCNCGIEFSMPDSLDDQLRECHNAFYCPKGHRQYYTGETELERMQKQRDNYLRQFQNEKNRRRSLARSNSALRGVITRMKKGA